MARRFAIIRNRESDVDVAVVVHDTETGRVVIKCRAADWPLQRAFDTWVDRPLIVHEPRDVRGVTVTVRRKVVRFDRVYLDHLLDRCIKRPYDVRAVSESGSTIRIDDLADQKAAEMFSATAN